MMCAGLRSLIAAATGVCLIGLVTPGDVRAHGLAPALLSLRETGSGRYEVNWRSSMLGIPGTNVRPVLPERCRQISAAEAVDDADRLGLRWTVDCGPLGLAGGAIAVDDLAVAKIDALLRIERRDGPMIQSVLSARTPSFTVPAVPSRRDVLQGYAALGLEQIVIAPDYLLFVFGLLLLVSASRRSVQTVAAFTLGHSLTLSAAALNVTPVPAGPVELLIALGGLTLAVELARDATHGTLLRRFPWALALLFGLLHGLGFAGALAKIGLPAGEIPLALLSFNVGVDLGQLAFIGTVLLLGALLARWTPARAHHAARPAVYAMGILSAFWCFERMAVWLG